jgi:2'-5' RNA ligase
LYPFVDAGGVDAELLTGMAELVSDCIQFLFRLEHVRRFPGDVTYLAPEPSDPFIALTERVCGRWPSHPPYQGAYEDIVPHLTVVQGAEPPALERRLAPLLPLETTATEIALLRLGSDGRWTTMERFPFGPPTID